MKITIEGERKEIELFLGMIEITQESINKGKEHPIHAAIKKEREVVIKEVQEGPIYKPGFKKTPGEKRTKHVSQYTTPRGEKGEPRKKVIEVFEADNGAFKLLESCKNITAAAKLVGARHAANISYLIDKVDGLYKKKYKFVSRLK